MAEAGEAQPIDDAEIGPLFGMLAGQRLALAVSGGPDSMALMHLVARWARTPAALEGLARLRRRDAGHGVASPGMPVGSPPREMDQPAWLEGSGAHRALVDKSRWPPIVVLTVNHGLRREAAGEAMLVGREAASLGLPHVVLTWRGDKPAGGIQAKARAARYRLMAEVIEAEAWAFELAGDAAFGRLALRHARHARWLVTAHHLEDQAETTLMRLARGSGVDGLSAMPALTELALPAGPDRRLPMGVAVARPLLGISKARLGATLAELGGAAVHDPSNDDRAFERVRLRQASAHLGELGLTPDMVALSARRLARAGAALEAGAREAVARLVRLHGGIVGEIDLAGLLAAPDEIAIRVIRAVMAVFSGRAEPPNLAPVEDLLEALRGEADHSEGQDLGPIRETGGAATDGPAMRGREISGRQTLAGCVIATDWAGCLQVWREAGRSGLPRVALVGGATVVWDLRFLMTAGAGIEPGLEVAALGGDGWRQVAPYAGGLSMRHPRPALEAMPAIWRGRDIVAVPFLDAACTDEGREHGGRQAMPRSAAPWLKDQLIVRCTQQFVGDRLQDAGGL